MYMNKSPGIEVLYCIYSEQLLYIVPIPWLPFHRLN